VDRSSCRKTSAEQIFQWNINAIYLVSFVLSAVGRGKFVLIDMLILFTCGSTSIRAHGILQSDSFSTRPKKMRISQRLFIRF
jgi:hypothetical protein